MTRRAAIAFGCCALAWALPGPAGQDRDASAAASEGPSRLLVTAHEWRLTLSRSSVQRGEALIDLVNLGEDPHDLRLRRVPTRRGARKPRTLAVAEIAPGEVSELSARLVRGQYRLWCSLPGHRQAGMRASLRVR